MELTITDTFLKQLAQQRLFDQDLCHRLASDVLDQKDPLPMAKYLLTREAAEQLLASRIQTDPVGTLKAIESMPARKGKPAARKARKARKATRGRTPGKVKAKRRGRPPGRRPAAPKRAAVKKPRKRQKVNTTQLNNLKARVMAFLKAKPGSSRKEITAAVEMPSQAIYLKVMGELKQAGQVVAKGTRRSVTYSLR